MPVPIWAGHYIGLPFFDHGRDRSGLDCWGLVRLALGEQFGVALPSYAHEYQRSTQGDKISALIEREALKWKPVPAGNEVCGDVIVLRVRGKPMHVGLVLGDRLMLHIEAGINSVIERYSGTNWAERVSGFYRYKNALDLDDDNFEHHEHD
jgi:cell wall-associated NlpC family hydrolase